MNGQAAFAEMIRLFASLNEPGALARLQPHAVLHHGEA
jgi:hypothetical protein